MGFYFRKSVNFGGVRFNFSKSGIGASVGVKGFRIGTGPRGNYIHMGSNGIYYRAALGQKRTKVPTNQYAPLSSTPVLPLAQEDLLFQEIESGDVSLIVDSSSQDLIDELNRKRKLIPFWPFALILAVIPVVGVFLAFSVAIALYFLIDRTRRTTIIFYDIEEQTEKEIEQFYSSFQELIACKNKWHVSAQAHVQNRKYHAGANSVVKRTPITIGYKTPPGIKTNIMVPSIPVGRQTLYFLPECILVYQGKQVGGLSYESLDLKQYNQQFIEDGIVPRDATIVDRTWRYVNKNGGPDKRFKNNRELPVLLYSDIEFKSTTGLNERIELSLAGAGSLLNQKLLEYSRKSFLSSIKSLSLQQGDMQ